MKYFLFFFVFQSISYASEKVIVYEVDGTSVNVVYPTNDINSVIEKDVPKEIPYKIIEKKDIPSRRFRNAWKLEGNKIEIDMIKAREIRKKEILKLRDKKMKKEEIILDKALDEEDKQTEKLVRTKRIKLRELDSLDLSTVPMNELDSYIPKELE